MFAANAVVIEADGTRSAGRAAIDASMAKAFAGPLKGARCTVTVTAMTVVKPDVATADGQRTSQRGALSVTISVTMTGGVR